MEIPQAEYDALVAENKEMAAKISEFIELKAHFLRVVTKLGKICAEFHVDANLPDTETEPFFSRAVDERLKRENMVRRELKTAMERLEALQDAHQVATGIAAFFGGNGMTTNEAIEAATEVLKNAGLK